MRRRILHLTAVGALTAVVVSASFIAATLVLPRHSKADAGITVTVLEDTLGGQSAQPGGDGINNLGHVVGSADTDSGTGHAFYWDGTMHDLTPTSDSYSRASAINDSDQIVGTTGAEWLGETVEAVEWLIPSPMSAPTPLALPSNTSVGAFSGPNAISNQGQIVGTGNDLTTGANVPISWIGGVPTVLSMPQGVTGCQAVDVNDSGEIFGYCDDGTSDVWPSQDSPAPIALLPLTPGGSLFAFKINNLGHVVGISTGSMGEEHAVLWLDPTSPPEDLGALGLSCSDCTLASGVNDSDQVVGIGWTGSPAVDGPVLIENGTITPLGMPTNQNCGPAFPYAINNNGQAIAGTIFGSACTVLWSNIGSPPTPLDQIQRISTQVQGLVASGTLTSGEGNALQVKLNAALASLGQSGSTTTTSASNTTGNTTGNTTAACNQLQAFVNQVQAYVNSGRLTTAQGQSLISAANAVTTKLCI